MKLDTGLKLRKIGSHNMIVKAGPEGSDMTEVYSLNDTAAMLWLKAAGIAFTSEMMAGWLCEEYEVSPQTASEDIEEMLVEWRKYGLVK